MTQRLIPTHTIDDGFDRQNLSIIRKRFDAVNQDRLRRMRGALAERHQLFLDILPLLFHCNHPMLPGFVNRQTPCKVSGYKPDSRDLDRVRQIARSFTVNYEPNVDEAIYGIYVMGSVGTIAQSERSDLDFWLCHRPGMSQDALRLLHTKCERITRWAAEQRLEAHFFLMDYEAFQQGKLSSLDEESSGSAQRLLLLDEFYRSAIFVCGRMPLWWFVPDKDEKHYRQHAETLLGKRFLPPQHVLDFGGISDIPGGEFIGAGIWQLYKAIDSPYKSVLKLLLLEAYVSEFPNIQPLALQFKQQIYAGELDIDKLDSYVLVYRKIEQYLLSQGQHKRLELARRCFYFKVNRALSRASRRGQRPWQRDLLRAFVEEWDWDEDDVLLLDARHNWKIATVAAERAQLVNELNHSYQFLLEFAQAQGMSRAISAEELTVLGRKLQAAFERRPGKIEWINPNISKDLSEDLIVFDHGAGEAGQGDIWTASTVSGPVSARITQPIRSSNSFIELLLWCFYNGIIEKHTYLDFGRQRRFSVKSVRRLLALFEMWLPKAHDNAEHSHFYKASKPLKAMMLLNVGLGPSPELTQGGLQRLTENSDALSYGGREENLVASVDLITVNSWNEVHTRRYEREHALLDALKDYLQLTLPGTHHAPPELRVECIGSEHSSLIVHRVKEWLGEIQRCFYATGGAQRRYVFHLSERFHTLQFVGMRPVVQAFANEKKLIHSLSADQHKYSGLRIDSRCLQHTPMPFIASKMKRNTISIFYRRFDIGMETYVADEKGSISHSIIRGQRDHNPLVPLHRFLRAVIQRQARSQPDLLSDFGICPIYFYELKKRSDLKFIGRQTPISQDTKQTNMFEVKAIAHCDDDNTIHFDFYCDDQEFSSRSFKDQLYLVVAQFILSRRNRGENYPIYMTDLDLSLCAHLIAQDAQLQMTHYLEIKNALEARLNEAIGVLIKA